MFDPEGVLRDVPFDKVNDFRAHGGEVGVRFSDPNGNTRYAPASKLEEVAQHGGKILPIQEQAVPHASVWQQFKDSFSLPGAVNPYPSMGVEQKQEMATQAAQDDATRKAEGHGIPYRVAAGATGAIAPVTRMEEGAREGDPSKVIGSMLAGQTMAAAPLIMEGAGKSTKLIPESVGTKISDAVRDVTPKQAAQVVAGTAGAVGGHGALSVPAATASAHYMGNIVESILGKERANAPIIPRPIKPVYPGATQPTMPPEVAQAAGLGQVPKTGALPASQTGEALATIPSPKIGEVAPPPQTAATVEPTPAPSPAREAAPPSEVTLTGESALRKILTGQDNANLMKIAKSRGINVTQETQLKPGVADNKLINKIIESHSEEELQKVRDMYLENSRFKHSFGDIGPEAWKALSMQSYFPDVKIPATVLKRMESAIKTARPVAEAPAASTDDLMPQLQKSLEMAKKLRASQTQ